MVTPRTDSKACREPSWSDAFVVSPSKTHFACFTSSDPTVLGRNVFRVEVFCEVKITAIC